MRRRTVLAGLAALPALSAAAATPRPFRMGATRWPPEATLAGLARVERFLRDRADMAAPMILGGVPWEAARTGAPFSPALSRELRWKAPAGHPVALSLGALDTMRGGLAPHYALTDNQPLPPAWAGRTFDDPAVIAAYAAFCIRAAETMRPDWLFIGVEVNILLAARPDLWPAYLAFHRATVARIRAALPGQKIGFTIAALHYLGLVGDTDAARQAREMAALADSVDIVGWSVYPHTSWQVELPLSPGWFDFITDFARRTGKPVAVTESGMSARRVWIGWVPLPGSEADQAGVMAAMLAAAGAGGWDFVVNWTSHDYPALLDVMPDAVRELAEIWVWTGILGPRGEAKAVTAVWDTALARPFG